MVDYYDVEQNTEEWQQLRCGCVGGSSIGKIMANYGKAFGQPAKDLATIVAVEQLTENKHDNGIDNKHTRRGHEQEPFARELYAEEKGCEVLQGGFWKGKGCRGVSPDGIVTNGLIEIKSVIPSVHYNNIARGSFDPTYKWQLFYNLLVTELEFIDFVSYCAEFPVGFQLYTCRITKEASQDMFYMIEARLEQLEKLVEERKEMIFNANYAR